MVRLIMQHTFALFFTLMKGETPNLRANLGSMLLLGAILPDGYRDTAHVFVGIHDF